MSDLPAGEPDARSRNAVPPHEVGPATAVDGARAPYAETRSRSA